MFKDVWFVDGLKVNLQSISQICDNGMNVLFTKYECEILDDGGDCICVGEEHLIIVMVQKQA